MASEVFFVLLDCWIIKPFKQLTGRFEAGESMERMFKASHKFRSYSFLSHPSGCSEMLNRFTILSHRWDKAEFCDFEVTKSEQAQSVHPSAQKGKLISQNMKSTSHFKKREVDFPPDCRKTTLLKPKARTKVFDRPFFKKVVGSRGEAPCRSPQ
ncbi:MAG: hypothetical protein IJ265_09025 [Oscillospiraceae bacterium]|nr:hypothetical protein [Oscillospiraceae bacterium]